MIISRTLFSKLMGLKRPIETITAEQLAWGIFIYHKNSGKAELILCGKVLGREDIFKTSDLLFKLCTHLYGKSKWYLFMDSFCLKFLGPFHLLLQEEATKKSPHSLRRNELHLQTSLWMEKRPQMTWFDAMGLDMVQILIWWLKSRKKGHLWPLKWPLTSSLMKKKNQLLKNQINLDNLGFSVEWN